MPDFTIKGNPGAVRSRAATTRSKADQFMSTGDGLAKVTTDGWNSRAADRFRERFDTEPERWREAGDGFVTAAGALEAYADALQDAQRRAAWAEQEYARGEQVTHDAKNAYDADVARAKDRVNAAAAAGQHMTLTIIPFHDPGAAVRQGALDELASAKHALDAAAHRCADGVRAGCRNAPAKRKWYEKVGAAVGGFLKGAGEALLDLGKLAAFLSNPAAWVFNDMMSDAASGMTAEEIAAKWQLKVEDAEGMLQALQDDPLEFGKNIGKAMLDWDTWADDPARALGHLVPDAIIAVLTAGSGTVATRGAKAGVDGLDALAGMNKLDDLSGLSHVDDLADAGKLDDLGDLGDLGKVDDADLGDLGKVDLTDAEKKGFDFYTGFGYDHVNSYLRGTDNMIGADIYTPEQLARYSDEISSGLDKLPTHDGQTFRGTNLPDSVLDQIDKTGTFKDDAFLSSSTDPAVAERFRAGQGGNAMFHIDGSSGHDVKSLSQFGNEAEILFDKGTAFSARKVWNEAGGYWDIYLKEKP